MTESKLIHLLYIVLQSLQILYIFVLRAEIGTIFGSKIISSLREFTFFA
jgi:hypothetical protein